MKQYQTGLWHWLKGFVFRHMHNMISCREFEDFVQAYVDGELSTQQQARFESHILMCRECREYLYAYKRSIEVGQAVCTTENDMLPDDVPEDLIKAIVKLRTEK